MVDGGWCLFPLEQTAVTDMGEGLQTFYTEVRPLPVGLCYQFYHYRFYQLGPDNSVREAPTPGCWKGPNVDSPTGMRGNFILQNVFIN